jgi:hypothetical protein
MHQAIAELRRLVPPPDIRNRADGDWAACEKELQLRLPVDYKEFISTYGSGTLCSLFAISSPFETPRPREWWTKWAGIYDCWGDVPRALSYPRYPAVPGLLPWGTYGDVDVLSWFTDGEPHEWRIVYDDREEGFFEIPKLGFAEFLLAALKETVPLPKSVFSKELLDLPSVFKPF